MVPRLVVIEADVDSARAAHSLGCHTVFLQPPGSPVEELVDAESQLYSVDCAGALFPEFVDTVLRPLAPDAVVPAAETGALPAAVARAVLGLPGTSAETVRRLREGAGVARGRALGVQTFSVGGRHRVLAVVGGPSEGGGLEIVSPESGPAADLEKTVCGFLERAGLTDGPAYLTVALDGGRVDVVSGVDCPGPGDVPALVRQATGVDVRRWAFAHALGIPSGEPGAVIAEEGA
ncbi:hypothetical protein [Streptomyces sp. NPDC046727]|uniref:hypothetical protein n=1 Tax=Streptomyces sp. NPDC046727 TaxID=3155373 RepID=UPI0033DD67B7